MSRKPIDKIEVGDWVLGDSLLHFRVVGSPWQVTRISGKRLYLTSYRATSSGELEVRDERIMMAKTVRMVFSDMESAQVVSDFARQAGDDHDRRTRELLKQMRADVEALANKQPKAPT